MADLSLTNIHKSFGDTKVIHGVDLEVEAGEFTVFVGPSGCGKSTLLRMIAGLESVTNGSVAIGGAEVTHSDPSDRGVTMVFQSYALYPHMSVYDNMAFSLKMNGAGAAEIDSRVRKAADILGLHDLLERKPKALSGGQRQRVAIGRSIVREPKIFLFDEPLSNLDAELRVQMRLEIRAPGIATTMYSGLARMTSPYHAGHIRPVSGEGRALAVLTDRPYRPLPCGPVRPYG